MTPEQFCYWLQGRAELMPDTPPTDAEWKMIADHLGKLFVKVTKPLDQYSQLQQVLCKQQAIGYGGAALQC